MKRGGRGAGYADRRMDGGRVMGVTLPFSDVMWSRNSYVIIREQESDDEREFRWTGVWCGLPALRNT